MVTVGAEDALEDMVRELSKKVGEIEYLELFGEQSKLCSCEKDLASNIGIVTLNHSGDEIVMEDPYSSFHPTELVKPIMRDGRPLSVCIQLFAT